MEPVINPWLFYLIDGASDLKWGALSFGLIIGVLLSFCGAWSIDEADSKEEVKSAKKNDKKRNNYFHHRYRSFRFLAIFGNSDEDGHSKECNLRYSRRSKRCCCSGL